MTTEIQQQQRKKVDANMLKRLHPGSARKKLPWLDGRSSIGSSPLVSPPDRALTPRREDPHSPLLGHYTNASAEITSEPQRRSTRLGSIEPDKRLSIVHTKDSDMNMVDQLDTYSLVPIPDHVEEVETPVSLTPVTQRIFEPSPPRIIQAVQRSPSQPIPKPGVFERHSHRRLSNAIEGLEELVEDAVFVAECLDRPEHVEQIYNIIEDASIAVEDTSTGPMIDLMITSSPLQLSSEEVSHFSSEVQVLPELLIDKTIEFVPSPLQMVEQKESEAMDWAYCNTNDDKECFCHHSEFSTSSSSPSSPNSFSRRHVRRRSSSDRLQLLRPEPVATTPRNNIFSVLRPMMSRSHSRGRSRERRNMNVDRQRHRQRHRSWRSDTSRASRKYHRCCLSSDVIGSLEEGGTQSFDKEGVRQYGEELHLRDTRHIFSLHRNHQRQPVARHWKTGKKRVCALVACLNTALLGIIVGIYASSLTWADMCQPC